MIGNLNYKFQDDELKDWKQIIDYKNDKKGVIIQIDEIQNWFNSKASKDFPPEMTQVVTTNRKQRRVIMGTAQRFYMIAKDIRTQVTEVRNCTTLFGCLTIVHRQQPIINADGVRTPLRNDSRTVEVRHPDRRKQTPLPLVRQLEKLAWGPACCQSPRRLFYSIMPLRFLMVSPSIRMI